MNCDLHRLQIAVDAAVKRSNDDLKFQAQIHGVKIKDPILPVRTAAEQAKRARATFSGFGTVKVTR